MDLKKGLSLTAFGFAFVLINLNLTLGGVTLNVTPDFIGWIMLTLAVDRLGKYTDGKKYLKFVALVMVILSASVWTLQIMKPEYDISILTTLENVVAAVFMFIFFGCLELVANDYGSPRESTIRTLKILTLALNIAMVTVVPLHKTMPLETFAVIFAVLGVAAIVTAIVTLIVLFKLRDEIHEKLDAPAAAEETEEAEEAE